MKYVIPLCLFAVAACNNAEVNKSTAQQVKDDSIADTKITNSLIIAERIDGPANIRDTVNGNLLFTLNDNCIVTTTEAENGWCQVGIVIDLPDDYEPLQLKKNQPIIVDGRQVGQTVQDTDLQAILHTVKGKKGELVAYTSLTNIKPYTIVENALTKLVNDNPGNLTLANFNSFLKNFEFVDYDGILPRFKGYEIEDNWIDDPSPLLRLWLLFEKNQLFAIIHSRKLKLNNFRVHDLDRGFYISVRGYPDQKIVKQLIEKFNEFVGQVD